GGIDVLWTKLRGHAPSGRLLRRQDPERCEGGRLARGAARKVRSGHQHEGRESARPDDPAVRSPAGYGGHSVRPTAGDLPFEERLTREILQSERTRMLILAGLSGSLVATFPAHALRSGIFGTAWALQVVAVFVLLASYELTIRQVVGRRLGQGKTLPRPLRFLNAFVETSVPSILILLGSRQVDPVYALESAAAYMYPVFIVLSTLRLDFRLSVFTGCVAAVEYVILSFALVGGSEVA